MSLMFYGFTMDLPVDKLSDSFDLVVRPNITLRYENVSTHSPLLNQL